MASEAESATHTNWRERPYSKWAFRNTDKVLNTTTVAGSSTPAPPFETRDADLSSFQLKFGDKTLDLDAFLAASETDSLLVLKDNKLVLERYANGNDASSKHILMALTKSITGLLVGILQGQGKLHADDLVSKYVPEVRDGPYANLTIRQCIDMRAQLKHDDAGLPYRVACGWSPRDDSASSLTDNLHEYISSFRLPPAPDSSSPSPGIQDDRFEYVSLNTDLVGWVLERAAGGSESLAQLISRLLWQPLGNSSATLVGDPHGAARASGGLAATARDTARLGNLLTTDGGDIIPKAWLDDIMQGGDTDAWNRGAWAPGFKRIGKFTSLSYRSHCLADPDQDMILMSGLHGQMLSIDRRNKLVMVKLSSQPNAIDYPMTGMSAAAFYEFGRILNK